MDAPWALVPYHFGLRWDIIPNRSGAWAIIDQPGVASRLRIISQLHPSLVVSGDCMAAIAVHREGLPLVWFDAHGDFHTLETTETGSLGGMPLAMLRGLGDRTLMNACTRSPVKEVYHVGGSEFDVGERERMVEDGVIVTHRAEISYFHHLHIDTDVIRSSDLPSSIHPAPNGIPLEEFYKQLNELLPNTEVLSIKTYDPRLDISGKGEKIVLEIINRYRRYL